jgi:hypothetical protein
MNAKLRARTSLALLPFSLAFSAPGLRDALQDKRRAESALKSELGIDAFVTVYIDNGHTSVAVRLPSPPSGNAADVKRAVTAVVIDACHLNVEHVDISY